MAWKAIDQSRGIEGWFEQNVADAKPPLTFERISGGRSNITYAVADSAGGRWALRRPPLGKRLASAHDMGREYRIISALGPTEVPVPPAVGLCEDDGVNGDPFYVMGWVDGPDPALEGRRPTSFPARTSAARSASGWSTRWSRSTPSTPTRSDSASWRRRRTTSPASCTAGTASGTSSTPASCR